MSAFAELNKNGVISDGHSGGCLDEIAEDMPGLRGRIGAPESGAEHPVEAGAYQGQLQIAIDLEGNRRGQCVHVEEVDAVGDGVLYEHSLGVVFDQVGDPALQLIDEQQGWLFVV